MVHVDHLKPHLGKVPAVWRDVVEGEELRNVDSQAESLLSEYESHESHVMPLTEPETECSTDTDKPMRRRSKRINMPTSQSVSELYFIYDYVVLICELN